MLKTDIYSDCPSHVCSRASSQRGIRNRGDKHAHHAHEGQGAGIALLAAPPVREAAAAGPQLVSQQGGGNAPGHVSCDLLQYIARPGTPGRASAQAPCLYTPARHSTRQINRLQLPACHDTDDEAACNSAFAALTLPSVLMTCALQQQRLVASTKAPCPRW